MKEEDSKLKEFTEAADVIQASMDMWGEEFDKWADTVESLEEEPSSKEHWIKLSKLPTDDISYADKKMRYALGRMKFEQKQANELNAKINSHLVDKFVRGELDNE